jgi:hemerythrin superfamily protein
MTIARWSQEPAARGRNAVKATDLLKKDHDTVKKMLAAFEKMGERAHQKRQSQAEEICQELRIHAAIEEEIFYPAVRSVKDKHAKFDIEEALQEHKQMKSAIEDILQVEGEEPAFGAKMKVLQEDVEHHADEEEKEVFKEARKLGNEKLEELGQQLQERKEELNSRSGSDNANEEETA